MKIDQLKAHRTNKWVLFNKHTLDGVAGAIAINIQFKEHPIYLGVDYSTIGMLPHLVRNKLRELIIVGLNLTKSDLERLSIVADTIKIFSIYPIEDFEYNGTTYVSGSIENRSACVSAWAHYHPTRKLPASFEAIEDVDGNKGQINNSNYIYHGLVSRVLGLSDEMIFLRKTEFLDSSSNIASLVAEGFQFYSHMKLIASVLSKKGSLIAFEEIQIGVINSPKIFNKFMIGLGLRDYPIYLLYEDVYNQEESNSPRPTRMWTIVANFESPVLASDIANLFGGFGSSIQAGFSTLSSVEPKTICESIVNLIKKT